MQGYINNNFEPIIEIGLLFGGKIAKHKAVIDTGFNGFISIPHKIIEKTAWRFIGYESYELASGEVTKDKVYLGDIIFCGKKQYTYILSNKTDDILIGTKLLANNILVIDFKSKIVKIEG